jgi:hypothetical protein
MICDQCIKEPDLWAECIKNLITVGSALIVSAYVAMAQFSHQSGKLSALQSKAFFKYVMAPLPSGLGFVLLLVSCALTTDNAGLLMKTVSLSLFAVACLLHGYVIIQMYEWSRGSNISNAFVGQNARSRFVRALLYSPDSMSFDQKAVHVVQHFKLTGKAASTADKRYAIRLILATVRQTFASYARQEKFGKSKRELKAYADQFFGLLSSARQMHELTLEEVEYWYNPTFVVSLARRTRQFSDRHNIVCWVLHDHMVWLNKRLTAKDRADDFRYKTYYEALISEASKDYHDGLTRWDDANSILSPGLFVSIFETIGRVDFRSHSQVLSGYLDPVDESAFGRFSKVCFLDFARESIERNNAGRTTPFWIFCSSHLPELSLNHLLRLIQLEKDVLNVSVDRFLDRIAKTAGGDGIMTLVNPGDDIEAAIESVGKRRRHAAEALFVYAAKFSFNQEGLAGMAAALERKKTSAVLDTDEKTLARVNAALAFLAEHRAFVDEFLRQRKQKD